MRKFITILLILVFSSIYITPVFAITYKEIKKYKWEDVAVSYMEGNIKKSVIGRIQFFDERPDGEVYVAIVSWDRF